MARGDSPGDPCYKIGESSIDDSFAPECYGSDRGKADSPGDLCHEIGESSICRTRKHIFCWLYSTPSLNDLVTRDSVGSKGCSAIKPTDTDRHRIKDLIVYSTTRWTTASQSTIAYSYRRHLSGAARGGPRRSVPARLVLRAPR